MVYGPLGGIANGRPVNSSGLLKERDHKTKGYSQYFETPGGGKQVRGV
jgi:hypothetical protein